MKEEKNTKYGKEILSLVDPMVDAIKDVTLRKLEIYLMKIGN